MTANDPNDFPKELIVFSFEKAERIAFPLQGLDHSKNSRSAFFFFLPFVLFGWGVFESRLRLKYEVQQRNVSKSRPANSVPSGTRKSW